MFVTVVNSMRRVNVTGGVGVNLLLKNQLNQIGYVILAKLIQRPDPAKILTLVDMALRSAMVTVLDLTMLKKQTVRLEIRSIVIAPVIPRIAVDTKPHVTRVVKLPMSGCLTIIHVPLAGAIGVLRMDITTTMIVVR